MSPKLHAAAGTLGLGLIGCFWVATLWSELTGSPAQIAAVKQAILYGLVLLVPALAVAGAGGAALARGRQGPVIDRKTRRMRQAALNGLIILVPCAIFLAQKAGDGQLDAAFYAVQGLELVAGALNLRLLGANLRDGMAMARARGRAGAVR